MLQFSACVLFFFLFFLHIFFTFSFRHSWMWLVWYAGTVISYNPYLVPLISKWHTEQIHRLLIQPQKVVNHWTWKHILLYLPSRFELLLYERHSVYHFILTCAFRNSNAAQTRQEGTLLFKLFASADFHIFLSNIKAFYQSTTLFWVMWKAHHLAFPT